MSFPQYPEYKDSGVEWLDEVPAHWVVAPFKWQLDANDGGAWGDEPTGGDVTFVLRSTDQSVDGEWKINDPAPRALSERDKRSTLLKKGDLVVTKSSGSSLHIGKTTLVSEEVEAMNCCFGNFMQRLRTKSSLLPKHAWYIMNNRIARLQLDLLSNSTTGLANLNGTIIGEIILSIPPVDEQATIAAFLDHETARIDALVEEQQRLIALLKEKRQAVISHAVTKGLDPDVPMKNSGIEWLGEVPAHWEVRKVSYDFTAVKGPRGAKLTKEYCGENPGPYPVYSGQTDNAGVLGTIDDFDFSLGENGGLLTTTVGAKAMSLNFVKNNVSLSQNCMLIRPLSKKVFIRFYYYHFQPLFSLERGMIPDHMQPSFRMEDLYSFYVALPPFAEQEEIAHTLDAEMEKLDTLGDEAIHLIKRLKERRSALISEAVTGKIDVRGWAPPANAAPADQETHMEVV